MRGGIINTQSPFNPAPLGNDGGSFFNPAPANTSGSSPNLFQGGKRRKSKRGGQTSMRTRSGGQAMKNRQGGQTSMRARNGGQSAEDINISVPSNATVDINEMPMSSLSNL